MSEVDTEEYHTYEDQESLGGREKITRNGSDETIAIMNNIREGDVGQH